MSSFNKVISKIVENLDHPSEGIKVIKLQGFGGNASAVRNTINAIEELGEPNPMGDGIIIDNGVKVEVGSLRGRLYLKHIMTLPEFRNQGLATAVLGQIKDIALENDVGIILFPKSLSDEMSTDQVTKWYENQGFTSKGDHMVFE